MQLSELFQFSISNIQLLHILNLTPTVEFETERITFSENPKYNTTLNIKYSNPAHQGSTLIFQSTRLVV